MSEENEKRLLGVKVPKDSSGANQRVSSSSRARNKTVMLSPEMTGQFRALLDNGEEKKGADDGFVSVGRGRKATGSFRVSGRSGDTSAVSIKEDPRKPNFSVNVSSEGRGAFAPSIDPTSVMQRTQMLDRSEIEEEEIPGFTNDSRRATVALDPILQGQRRSESTPSIREDAPRSNSFINDNFKQENAFQSTRGSVGEKFSVPKSNFSSQETQVVERPQVDMSWSRTGANLSPGLSVGAPIVEVPAHDSSYEVEESLPQFEMPQHSEPEAVESYESEEGRYETFQDRQVAFEDHEEFISSPAEEEFIAAQESELLEDYSESDGYLASKTLPDLEIEEATIEEYANESNLTGKTLVQERPDFVDEPQSQNVEATQYRQREHIPQEYVTPAYVPPAYIPPVSSPPVSLPPEHAHPEHVPQYVEQRREPRPVHKKEVGFKSESKSSRTVSRSQVTPVVGFLISFDEDRNGEVFEIRAGRWLLTSRPTDHGDYILIDDETISPLHAIIRATGNAKVQVLDQLSEYGTAVTTAGSDEEREIAGAMITVEHGDRIRFGNRHFVVCLVPQFEGGAE